MKKEDIFFDNISQIGAVKQSLSTHTTPKFSRGAKVDEIRDIKDIAKAIREYVKKKYPKCKFSVTIERYSGGQSLYVSLQEAPFNPIINEDAWQKSADGNKYASVNQYYLDKSDKLSPEAVSLFVDVRNFYNQYNYNHSDSQSDYFSVNFYETLSIGRWDKGFVQVKSKEKTPKTPKTPSPKKEGTAKFLEGSKVNYKTSKGQEAGTVISSKFIASRDTYLYQILNPRGGTYNVWESNIISGEKTPEPKDPEPENSEILALVTAYSFSEDGKKVVRTEEILEDNVLFENAQTPLEVKQIYENFWKGSVVVTSVKMEGVETEFEKEDSEKYDLDTIWKKAFSSEKLSVEIDIENLKKAIYSKRRSKQMKFDIARAFGVIRFFDKTLDPKSFAEYEILRGEGNISQERVFKYELDEELLKTVPEDFEIISQISNYEAEDWVNDMIFPTFFEQPIKDDKNKRLLLNYFESKYDKKNPIPEQPKSDNSLALAIEELKETNDALWQMYLDSENKDFQTEARVITNDNCTAINEFSADLEFDPEKFLNNYFEKATQKIAYDNTELTREEFDKIVNSKEFIDWFGDFRKGITSEDPALYSKVVTARDLDTGDANLTPQIVYHGTWNKSHFSRFKFNKFPIIYFATNKTYAQWFANLGSGIIYECFLDIKYICDFRELGLKPVNWSELSKYLNERYGVTLPDNPSNQKKVVWAWIRSDAPELRLINTIKESGFTGMCHIENNPQDKLPNGEDNTTQAYMIFSPEQAKLVRYVSSGNSFTDIFFMKKGGKIKSALLEKIKNLKV